MSVVMHSFLHVTYLKKILCQMCFSGFDMVNAYRLYCAKTQSKCLRFSLMGLRFTVMFIACLSLLILDL